MSKLDRILHEEMTRRQFLLAVGATAVSLLGLSAVMGALTKDDDQKNQPPGYGMQNYGP